MRSFFFRDDRGFTLVELIMVIVIIGILASVAVPKFINLTSQAQDAKCDANRGAIASAVAMTYAALLIADPTQGDWLEDATMDDVDDSMFASGSIPTCPTSGTYTLSAGNVTCSVHGS